MGRHEIEKIKGYCALCANWCPTVSWVRDGVFTEVRPDEEHPLACGLCPKGLAGPELVYNKQRLQYPVKRTRPKGDGDPGWTRISWDEALDTIATRLNEVKARYGPQAVVLAQCGPGGSSMMETIPWVTRLANAFGTPNSISTTHICQWHRDNCSAYTYGNIGGRGSAGEPEFERAACILIWGSNVHATRNPLVPLIDRGLERGAKLIVVDPRQTRIAGMADLWLEVRPGTDGALALSMINVMMAETLYEYEFVRDWTTAPFLVRSDTGSFLRASDLADDAASSDYVIVDSVDNGPKAYLPGTKLSTEPILDVAITPVTTNGKKVECKTVFRLLREAVSGYHPDRVESITGVPREKITSAARMLATIKPACWYSWNGIEQSTNASQTNRALCILYALTGNYDGPGGNVVLPPPLTAPVDGRELISVEAQRKLLGCNKRPLGPAGLKFNSTQAYEVYQAILTGRPYPVKAMLGFGGNLISSSAPTLTARKAIARLDFHAQAELFMSPTAELADIVIPAASCWESWHVGAFLSPLGEKAYLQWRPATVPPQHESRPDREIIFELAMRLGLGDKFWGGDIRAALDYQLAPLHVTVEQLKMRGSIAIDLSPEYRKYSRKDSAGNFAGFPTTSKRIEIYSPIFKEHGYSPLPTWHEPACFRKPEQDGKYPLILTGSKVAEYCHSQHRALPSLRKRVPNPFLEVHPQKALELGFKDGDWLIVETAYGQATLQARLTEGIPYDVVCAQHGWWQACPELSLPGYDPYSERGANVNLLYSGNDIDPISGSLPIKGQPCNIRKVS